MAGFAVPADVLARFERLRGSRVLMASGTDEHGTPITYEADKKGIAPQDFVDQHSATIVDRGLSQPIRWRVNSFTLVASETAASGPVYRTVAEWPLVSV